MIEETALAEKVVLVKWAVRLFGEHPSIDIVNLDQSSKINLDKKLGNLVNTCLSPALVTELCDVKIVNVGCYTGQLIPGDVWVHVHRAG